LIGQPIYVRHHSSEVRVELLISPHHVCDMISHIEISS
jgi:hypothetical protein